MALALAEFFFITLPKVLYMIVKCILVGSRDSYRFLYKKTMENPLLMFAIFSGVGGIITFLVAAAASGSFFVTVVAVLLWAAFMAGVFYVVKLKVSDWWFCEMYQGDARAALRGFYGEDYYDDAISLVKTRVHGVYELIMVTPNGKDDASLMKQMPAVAAALHAVTYEPDDKDPRAGYVTVIFAKKDLLSETLDSEETPALNATQEQLNGIHQWLPVGKTIMGDLFELPLNNSDGSMRYIVTGASGSGKSSVPIQVLLHCIESDLWDVMLSDMKPWDLKKFAPYVQSYAYKSADLMRQLDILEGEIERRMELLQKNIRENPNKERVFESVLNPFDDGPEGKYLVWMFDERLQALNGMNPKMRDEYLSREQSIMSVFRSTGISVFSIGQNFRSDVMPTATRDQMFNAAIGHYVGSFADSTFAGWTAEDTLRPDTIPGHITRDGNSAVGKFVVRGIQGGMAKSYFPAKKDQQKHLEEKCLIVNPDESWEYQGRPYVLTKAQRKTMLSAPISTQEEEEAEPVSLHKEAYENLKKLHS
jgi:hypothetical protein